ncbi:sodium/potassium-transporting ATPase subunit gamma-like [Sinocyclocheilus anshuiensis]|uniref:sodium/potassium-transporting ATPase subunit gamma-like n=1 Tax=Sinocyclocheilus anshuiensis TaxID=1608454 RepID=UPI0007BA3A15|nr:PREDICTED: sodium/potassium-transporting ATPase subunit gamma-like [Sinocyclocheilus anshuiensis]
MSASKETNLCICDVSSVSSISQLDPDADFYYDYETLRIGGLVFAGVIVVLSVLLLTGNRIRRCGKPKKPLLSKKNFMDRLKCCRKYKDWTAEDCSCNTVSAVHNGERFL